MKPAIEITSRCNFSCQFCPYRQGNDSPDKGDMDFELFKEIVDMVESRSDELMLFNRGEPFMHPRVYDMIEYAHPKLPLVIATNAVLVDVDRLYDLIDWGYSTTIAVSFQAGHWKTYKKITQTSGNQFKIAKKKLVELQKKKPDNINLYTKMVMCKQNQGQEKYIKKFADSLVLIEDSNQPNPHGYTDCTQPTQTPTWSWDGTQRVCCRTLAEATPENINKGVNRQLDDCKNCAIR